MSVCPGCDGVDGDFLGLPLHNPGAVEAFGSCRKEDSMRLSTRVLIPIFFLASICSALATDAKSDVTAADKAWDAAFNSGDAKAIAASYAGDAELLPPTHTIAKGPAEIEKFFDGLLKGGVKSHALSWSKLAAPTRP